MSFKHFVKELNGNRVEGELIKTALYSLIISLVILGILYYFDFKFIDGFLPKYGLYLFLGAVSIAFIIPIIKQVRAYKEFACMAGMMIGMTAGMISGFLIGYYIGATNGMFMGSIFGMLVGIVIGVWMGKCCGIMGIMEGLMAGFMGGLMGAMTSVMLINDHLQIASIIISIIGWVILISLNYMIFHEMKESEVQRKEDYTLPVFLTIILIAILTWVIVYGPRGGVYG